MLRMPSTMLNVAINNRTTALQPTQMTILITLSLTTCLHMPLILTLHIICLQKQPSLLENSVQYIILSYHLDSVPLIHHVLSKLPAVIISYTPMVSCTLLIWPMSPTGVHRPGLIRLDHLLMEDPTVLWQLLMSTCSNIPNNM